MRPGSAPEQRLGLGQVAFEETDAGRDEGVPVPDDGRVAVHVDHPGVRVAAAGGLVRVRPGGEAGADVEVLVHARVRHVGDGVSEMRSG